MRFALLQTTLDRPAVEPLQRAFRSVRCLTDADAHSLANDAYGILVKGLNAADAAALQAALKSEAVLTEVVAERDVPILPQSKTLKRADCTPDALLAYDPVGRTIPIRWADVTLVAAGNVRLTHFTTERRNVPVPTWGRREGSGGEFEPAYRSRETSSENLVLDVILRRAVFRFHIEGARFNYSGLGARKTGDTPADFALLVGELCRCAPHALVNRGVFQLREGAAPMSYPSRNAYHEEIAWLLWRASQRG